MIPYGRQIIDQDDIDAVIETLRSDWLTTGPKVAQFEQALADYVGVDYAVAVSSGTAALHATMFALDIGPGDEVIVPPMTFAATANCVVYQGGTPVFADVDPDTLLIDPEQIEAHITPRSKAIIGVDYAGQACDWDALQSIADRHGLALVADSCHALGAAYKSKKVGTLADVSVFSFHPVKHITTGEGGMVVTNDSHLAELLRVFRNHGITTDHRQRQAVGSWFYEMKHLGYNYRITDFQCALGMSQLRKLPEWIAHRRRITRRYDAAFSKLAALKPLTVRPDVSHGYHLYVVQLDLAQLRAKRSDIFAALRADGIGVNVHYIPVYWHPYYQQLGYARGLCPRAEAAYEGILSLPIFNSITDQDVADVITSVTKVVKAYNS